MRWDSEESLRFFAKPVLSGRRFFAALRMTRSEGLRMTSECLLINLVRSNLNGC